MYSSVRFGSMVTRVGRPEGVELGLDDTLLMIAMRTINRIKTIRATTSHWVLGLLKASLRFNPFAMHPPVLHFIISNMARGIWNCTWYTFSGRKGKNMSLITTQAVSKSFGANDIFTDVSLSIPRRARIALVGANGIGKTTLLRILIGSEEPSGGRVQRAKGIRMGFLPQEAVFESEKTLWMECLAAFDDLVKRQAELQALVENLKGTPEEQDALELYGRLQEEFEHKGGYTYEQRIRRTLTGLGFTRVDEQRPIEQLSGGQRTRAMLARLLLENPDLLLLDEPTNHLDIAAVEWLEDYLNEWEGAVLIVSHDRYFLDRAVKTIWEMTPALETYHGNYTAYLHQRQERYERRLEEYERQQRYIEKQEDYIQRNIAGQNTRQARGRQWRLESLLEESKLTKPLTDHKMHLRLQAGARSGDLVLRTHDLQVGYKDEGNPLFLCPDLILKRGECTAILGPNGAGKTTFLKTILEQIPAYDGSVQLGAGLKIGYFAQAHEGLHPEWTLMQEIEAQAPRMLPAEIRNYLATFLFKGDTVFQTVDSLSGGERGRLALACLALQGSNLLLLDEPTNHLDLPSQELLQAVLGQFNGTILLVSHDRYLIDVLATQIWEVSAEQRNLTVFKGTYSEYRLSRQPVPEKKKSAGRIEKNRSKEQKNEGLSKDQLHKRQLRLQSLEEEIAQHEHDLSMTTSHLEHLEPDSRRVYTLSQEVASLQRLLDERLNEWEELSKEITGENIQKPSRNVPT